MHADRMPDVRYGAPFTKEQVRGKMQARGCRVYTFPQGRIMLPVTLIRYEFRIECTSAKHRTDRTR
jgi:hypothetical protein